MSYKIPQPLKSEGDFKDNREALTPGSEIISATGQHYKIKDGAAMFGGNSIIYRASRDGSLRNFIVKECYPYSEKFTFARKNGVVIAPEGDIEAEEYLRLVKNNMINENAIGQIIANKTGRAITAWEDSKAEKIITDGETFDAAESCFVVLEEATGEDKRGWFLEDLLAECAEPVQENAPLRNGGIPAPVVAASIMEELLKALRDVHKAGYIHGDINDANFFLMGADEQLGDIGVGQLLDFGNAVKVEADGKTLPLENVFSTSGYWSPEILEGKGKIRLSPATDIYSAGCLMLYLLRRMRYKKVCGRNLAKNFSVASFAPLKKLLQSGYRREAAILFGKILAKALAYRPEDRYKNAGEMLRDIIFLKKIIEPPKFTLSQNLSRSPYFVNGSRDEEINRLQNELDDGANILWIWGIGGVGKTELAMEFARKQIEQGRPAYLVTFKQSVKNTILNMNFSGWQFEFAGGGDVTEAEYKARLDLLKENYKDALLIVDNFDATSKTIAELQSEAAYKDLTGLNLKLLFTTRARPNNTAPELNPLNEENALTLFKSIAKVSAADEKFVRKLIQEVECHPMTVEILAHTLKESWGTLTAKDLLFKLQLENLNSSNLPNVKYKNREERIYGHLRTLFKLFNVDDSYREILCHTTLLPLDGFDAAEFLFSEDAVKKKTAETIRG